ncbi:MAG: alpha/beta fold hydrolase [Methyloceanibacter sp.]
MEQNVRSLTASLEGLQRTAFAAADLARRAHAQALAAFGLGPKERPYRVAVSGGHWRLRDYGGKPGASPFLIVAAPIKRPYIWDLAPSASAVARLLHEGFHVYLIEWTEPAGGGQALGLDEHCEAISQCAAMIARAAPGNRPYLAGHSLGGTLAALFAAAEPANIRGLVLLGAPLCFEPGASKFRDALVALLPLEVSETDPFPGSLLSCMAAMADPGTFIWSRMMDAAQSASDLRALQMHALVERWSLDEAALPGKLVGEILQWLFRENRFCRGALHVRGREASPSRLALPTLAVVNTADEIAPLASIKPCLDAMPAGAARIIEYQGETGVVLQHLGVLIGRQAHARVWPEIVAWLNGNSAARAEQHHQTERYHVARAR